MTQSKLVVIETFFNRLDADLASSVLTAASIDSIVSPDDGGGRMRG